MQIFTTTKKYHAETFNSKDGRTFYKLKALNEDRQHLDCYEFFIDEKLMNDISVYESEDIPLIFSGAKKFANGKTATYLNKVMTVDGDVVYEKVFNK